MMMLWCWWTNAYDALMPMMNGCCWSTDAADVMVCWSCWCADAPILLMCWPCWSADVLSLLIRWSCWCADPADALILLMLWCWWCFWIRIRTLLQQYALVLVIWPPGTLLSAPKGRQTSRPKKFHLLQETWPSSVVIKTELNIHAISIQDFNYIRTKISWILGSRILNPRI